MIREKYERIELELIRFQTEDVILSSTFGFEEDETPIANNNNG